MVFSKILECFTSPLLFVHVPFAFILAFHNKMENGIRIINKYTFNKPSISLNNKLLRWWDCILTQTLLMKDVWMSLVLQHDYNTSSVIGERFIWLYRGFMMATVNILYSANIASAAKTRNHPEKQN